MTGDDPLTLSAAARREMGERVMEWVLAHFDEIASRPLYPKVDGEHLGASLSEPLPVEGSAPEEVLRLFIERIAPFGRNNGHPRMFGYVSSPSAFMATLADLLASAINQNVTSWRSAPAATEIEHLVIGWLAELLGFPGRGLLTSGGSMANLTALTAALRTRTGVDVRKEGVQALTERPVVYASSFVHMSIAKACELLGIGSNALTLIPPDASGRLDPSALEAAIEADRRAARRPLAVVANLGDVNTGAVDPIGPLGEVCRRHGMWLHVDGAYGGFAALAPSAKHHFAEIASADSISLDPHKWLYTPLDAGCLLVRDETALKAAFGHDADYIQVLGGREREQFAFWNHGIELSRRFRALKVWMTLKQCGTRALGDAVERNLALARRLAELVKSSEDFELAAPPGLSIVCFRHVPSHLRGAADGEVDALNRAIVERVQRGGEAYLSNVTLNGRFALRACIVNFRTREPDLALLLDILRRAAR